MEATSWPCEQAYRLERRPSPTPPAQTASPLQPLCQHYKPFTFGLSGDGKAHILCITISFHKWDFIFLLRFFCFFSFRSFVCSVFFLFCSLHILCAVCVVGPFSGFYTRFVRAARELRSVRVCEQLSSVYLNVRGYVEIALLPLALTGKKNMRSLHT